MNARHTAGFTLLEVMAAITVFLVGIVSILALLTAGTRLHQESQQEGVTADTAEEVLLLSEREVSERAEALRAGAPGGVPAGTLPDPAPWRPVPGHVDLNFRWSVRASTEGGLYLLVAEVAWLTAGKTRALTLERVLPRLESAAADARRMIADRK